MAVFILQSLAIRKVLETVVSLVKVNASDHHSFVFLTYTIVKSFGLSGSNISGCWKQHHSLISNLQNFHFSTVTIFIVTPKSYISTMLFLCW